MGADHNSKQDSFSEIPDLSEEFGDTNKMGGA